MIQALLSFVYKQISCQQYLSVNYLLSIILIRNKRLAPTVFWTNPNIWIWYGFPNLFLRRTRVARVMLWRRAGPPQSRTFRTGWTAGARPQSSEMTKAVRLARDPVSSLSSRGVPSLRPFSAAARPVARVDLTTLWPVSMSLMTRRMHTVAAIASRLPPGC